MTRCSSSRTCWINHNIIAGMRSILDIGKSFGIFINIEFYKMFGMIARYVREARMCGL